MLKVSSKQHHAYIITFRGAERRGKEIYLHMTVLQCYLVAAFRFVSVFRLLSKS